MERKHIVFYCEDTIEMSSEGLSKEEQTRLEELIADISEEIMNHTGFSVGEDYSFYINYDKTLTVESDNDEILDKVSEYFNEHYIVEFKREIAQ